MDRVAGAATCLRGIALPGWDRCTYAPLSLALTSGTTEIAAYLHGERP
jgi:hypothetical protein